MRMDPILSSADQLRQHSRSVKDQVDAVIRGLFLDKTPDMQTFFPNMDERLAAVNLSLRRTDTGSSGTIEAILQGGEIKYRIPLLGDMGIFDNADDAFTELSALRIQSVDIASHRSRVVGDLLGEAGYTSNLTNKLGGVSEVESTINEKIKQILGASISSQEGVDAEVMERSKSMQALLESLSKADDGTLKYDFNQGIQVRILNFGDEFQAAEDGSLIAGSRGKRDLGAVIAKSRKSSDTLAGSIFLDDKTKKILQMTVDGKIVDSHTTEMLLALSDEEVLDPAVFKKALQSGDSAKVMKNLQKIIKRAKGIISDRPISLSGDSLIDFLSPGTDALSKQLRDPTVSLEVKKQLAQQRILIQDKRLTMFEKFAFGAEYNYNDIDEFYELFSDYGKAFNPKATAELFENVNVEDYFGGIIKAYVEDDLFQDVERGTKDLRLQEVDRLKSAIIEHNKQLKAGVHGNTLLSSGGRSLENNLLEQGFNEKFIKNLFLSIETAADGSTIANSAFFIRAAKTDTSKFIRENFESLAGDWAKYFGDVDRSFEELRYDSQGNVVEKRNWLSDLDEEIAKREQQSISGASESTKTDELKRLRSSLENGEDLSMVDRNLKHLDEVVANISADKNTIEFRAQVEAEQRRLETMRMNYLRAAEHDQIGARGNRPGLGNIKSIYMSKRLEGELSQYALVLDEFDFKPELGFGRDSFIINFSGIGGSSDEVAVDQLMTIFHGDIYESPEAVALRQAKKTEVFNEIQEILSTGKIPKKILEQIDADAAMTDADLNMLDATQRPGALRNRMIAREVQLAIAGTSNPSEHPAVINQIFRSMQSQLYEIDYATNRIAPIDPGSTRLALNTELQAISGDPIRKPFLGNSRVKSNGIKVSDEVSKILAERGIGDVFNQSANSFDMNGDLFKFRRVNHALLFGGDSVGVFRHALGGMDLDDKGLPRVASYIDANGNRNFLMPLLRQPTSTQEVVYGIPAMDYETLNTMFEQDENGSFLKNLDELIEERIEQRQEFSRITNFPGMNPTEITETATDDLVGLRRLRDILGWDKNQLEEAIKLNPLEIEDAEQVKRAFFNVYENMERKGTIAIENLGNNASVAESLIRYGSTPLRVGDLTAEPQYTRGGVFKIFEESGAYDFSTPVKQVLYDDINSTKRRALIPDNILAEIEATLDSADNELLEVLGKHYEEPTVRELLASTFNAMEINKSQQALNSVNPGGVGSSINTLTVVGGTRDWIEQTVRNLPENQRNIILKNFQIGQLSAETFVDLSVGFAGTRQLAAGAYEAIEMFGPFVNEEGVKLALAETFGVGKKFAGGFSISDITEEILSATGRQVGAAAYFAGVGGGVIDKEIIEARLFADDPKNFLREMRYGMEEAKRLHEAPLRTKKGNMKKAVTQEQLAELSELEEKRILMNNQIEEILNIQVPNKDGTVNEFETQTQVKRKIKDLLGFDEDHEFAHLSRQQKEIKKTHREFTERKRNALRESYKKEIDYFAGETQEDIAKARQAAEKLIEDRRSPLQYIFGLDSEADKFLDPFERFNFDIISEGMARDVYHGIAASAQAEGLNAEIVINAVDEYLSKAFLDETGERTTARMPDLLTLSPSALEETSRDPLMRRIYDDIILTRELRDVKKYASKKFAEESNLAKDYLDQMPQLKTASTIEELTKRAEVIIEANMFLNPQGVQEELTAVDKIVLSLIAKKDIPAGTTADQLDQFGHVARALVARHRADNELAGKIDFTQLLQRRGTARSTAEVEDSLRDYYSQLIGDAEEANRIVDTEGVRSVVDDIGRGVEDVARSVSDDIGGVQLPTYTRFKPSQLKGLFKNNKTVKGVAIATATAIAGSLIYTAHKGRSNDDMKGPALLPGGSAYEKMPTSDPLMRQYSASEYSPGSSYSVSVQGSREKMEAFNEQARKLTNQPIDTTIYNRIPSVTDDPYARIASSY